MRKQFIIFITLLAVNLLSAQNKGNTIIGKWIGTDERNETAGIEFIENGKGKLLMYGKEIPFDYKVNSENSPIKISLITKPKGKTLTMYGLIKFVDAETIKWELFPMAEKQPSVFSKDSVGTSIILKRTKA